MKKAVKIWLITAAVLVVLGVGLMTAALAAVSFDITKLGTIQYETNTYKVTEKFDKISIDETTADITFALADNKQCSVVCTEPEKVKHSVAVKDGVLTVKTDDERLWFETIGLTFESPKMTVYLPEKEYASLTVNTATGDVDIPKTLIFGSVDITDNTGDISCAAAVTDRIRLTCATGDICLSSPTAGEIGIAVTTGDIELCGVKAKKDIAIQTTTGDVTLENTVTEKDLSVESTTGDVELDRCDAKELTIETTTGDITGSLLTAKSFSAHSKTGDIDVPDSNASGGRCTLTTTTGDIHISIK